MKVRTASNTGGIRRPLTTSRTTLRAPGPDLQAPGGGIAWPQTTEIEEPS
jgi:hypothetical protein